MVEHTTDNGEAAGSIPAPGTILGVFMDKIDIKFSDQQKKKIQRFTKIHTDCNQPTTYILEYNGIGVSITILCTSCEEFKDLTEMETW